MLVGRFLSCTNHLKSCPVTGFQAALCIIHFIEAIVFGLFVAIMMFDQLTAIFENTPGIDALQNKKGLKRGKYESLVDVFAEPIHITWLFPLNMPKKSSFHSFIISMTDYACNCLNIRQSFILILLI